MNEIEMLKEQVRLLNELVKAKDAIIAAKDLIQKTIVYEYRYPYPPFQYPYSPFQYWPNTVYGPVSQGGAGGAIPATFTIDATKAGSFAVGSTANLPVTTIGLAK